MRKFCFILLLLIGSLNTYGRYLLRDEPKITNDVINRLNSMYLLEKYKECMDSCEYYIRYRDVDFAYGKHPYRDWDKDKYFIEINDIESYATILYLGSISVYNYSLSTYDRSIVDGIVWARGCIAIYDDYLHTIKLDKFSTAEDLEKYILYAERAMGLANIGAKFLDMLEEDRWVKKEKKWFNKKNNRIKKITFKNVIDKDSLLSNYPILEYKVNTFISDHIMENGDFKSLQKFSLKRLESLQNMIHVCDENNIYNSNVTVELNKLSSMLGQLVTEDEVRKKAGPHFERFCLEQLIKLQDISYFLNGSSRYSLFPSYSLDDIQNSLKDTDCLIFHFEAPVASGQFYFKYDLGSRYRNYALILSKDQKLVEVWHRGYINDSIVNNLDKIKECHPNATRFYYVGTPRMSFIDIAGTDSSIVRLHSLSQLLTKSNQNNFTDEITFIGDLNYSTIGEISQYLSDKKGNGKFKQLVGPAMELAQINTLFDNVRPICGDEAKRNIVANEISRCNGIVHISTHGEIFNSDYEFSPEELVLKRNVMDNCRLILSGYNDTPNSHLSYLSGSDILQLRKINASIVFLDACLSGYGDVGISGPVGIAEAFHQIGAKNIICYLEPVEDIVATQFSNSFYTELSKGLSCHDAFFKAKKSLNKEIKVVLWE